MKKITVIQDFEYHGEDYSVGDVVELVDHVAAKFCNRRLAQEYCEEEEEIPQPKKKKRRKKKKE